MKWPRPRFTVRGLMIAVATLAVAFGAISWVAGMRVRSAAYRQRAFEFQMSTLRSGSMVRTPDGRWVDGWEDENDWLNDARAWRMAARYLRLSYYPWLTAEPDEPPPRLLEHPRSERAPAQAGLFASGSGTSPSPASLDVPVDLASAGIGTVGVSPAGDWPRGQGRRLRGHDLEPRAGMEQPVPRPRFLDGLSRGRAGPVRPTCPTSTMHTIGLRQQTRDPSPGKNGMCSIRKMPIATPGEPSAQFA